MNLSEKRGKPNYHIDIDKNSKTNRDPLKKYGDLLDLDKNSPINNKIGQFSPSNIEKGKEIGRGAFSTVFEAKIKNREGDFALKTINYTDQKQELEKIITEIDCMNILRHNNILRLITAFYENSCINIVMPRIDGASLHDYLKYSRESNTNPLTEDTIGLIAYQTVQGLVYLRKNKYLHRDLKPSNILLSKKGEVKISDFGMARQLNASIELVTSYLGTVSYMAPERLNSEKYGFPSDVWSLGMILYECALGSFPIIPKNDKITFWDIIDFASQEFQIDLPHHYSELFLDFISKCLIRDQTKRDTIEQLSIHPWILQYKDKAPDDLIKWISNSEELKKISFYNNRNIL